MNRFRHLLWLLPLFLTACVSKKKYLTELSTLQEKADEERQALEHRLETANARIYDQELTIAEKNGAIEALFTTQDKLQNRIDTLQEKIEQLTASARARQQSLDAALREKAAEMAEKEQQLAELGALLDSQDAALQTVADSARQALAPFDSVQYAVDIERGVLSIHLSEALMFRRGSTSRMEEEGVAALERISRVLQNFPSLEITVIGHTDNQPTGRRSIDNNWDFSVLRAATVVRLFTEELDISTSRITAAGKGAFAPRASNETEEGRAANRRIQLAIQPDEAILERAIRRRLR